MKRYICTCGRTIFKASADNILVTNDIGVPYSSYPPGQHMIEVKCHSCKAKYSILFQ